MNTELNVKVNSKPYQFIYVADPMCSWCWGFSPTFERLLELHPVPLTIMAGGLRPGPAAQDLDATMIGHLEHHWKQVAEASGQPFNYDLFGWTGWRYDTELPCKSLVAMRALDSEDASSKTTVAWLKLLQSAFYFENIDITDSAVYPELLKRLAAEVDKASEVVKDSDTFVKQLDDEGLKTATYQEFAEMRQMGVNGFPTLILDYDEKYYALATGFSALSTIEARLEHYLTQPTNP